MKHLFFSLFALSAFLVTAPSLQAYSSLGDYQSQIVACSISPSVQTHPPSDTLVLKRKIYYGDKKIKNPRELKAVLETANDAETMRLFKKFKTTTTLANVFIIPVCIVAIPLMIASRGHLKKVVRRFNDVKMGRVEP